MLNILHWVPEALAKVPHQLWSSWPHSYFNIFLSVVEMEEVEVQDRQVRILGLHDLDTLDH